MNDPWNPGRGTIDSVTVNLSHADGGRLSLGITLSAGMWAQRCTWGPFGGVEPLGGMAPLGDFGQYLCRLMVIAGVTEWRELRGSAVRLRGTLDRFSEIGHATRDDWMLIPATRPWRPEKRG